MGTQFRDLEQVFLGDTSTYRRLGLIIALTYSPLVNKLCNFTKFSYVLLRHLYIFTNILQSGNISLFTKGIQ